MMGLRSGAEWFGIPTFPELGDIILLSYHRFEHNRDLQKLSQVISFFPILGKV